MTERWLVKWGFNYEESSYFVAWVERKKPEKHQGSTPRRPVWSKYQANAKVYHSKPEAKVDMAWAKGAVRFVRLVERKP